MLRAYKDLIKLYADREYSGKSIALDNVSHSKIRLLEILGETAEIGEGEKSPDNPFTLVGAVSPEIVISKKNLANCKNYVYRLNDTIVTNPVATNNILTISKVIKGTTNAFFGVICKVNPNTRYYIKKPAIALENTEVSITQPQIVVLEYLGKPTNETFSSDYTKTTVINTDGYLTMSKNTEYIVVRVQVAGAYEGNVTMTDVMVSLSDGDYEPYMEQTLPMVGRNLYEPVAENFSTLDLRIILSDNCVEIKNLNLTNEQWIGFYYSRKDLFQVKTKYTVVVEVLEAIYTGNVSINVFSFYTVNNTKDVFNTSQQLKNPTAGIYKITRTTISDFTNIAYAMRSQVYVAAGASLTSLKFRISIYRADDVDLDTFVYEPYKDTFELNSAGSVSDSYNPLTGEYVQRVGKLVLDGTESWTTQNIIGETGRYVLNTNVKPLELNSHIGNIISTHYKTNSYYNLINVEVEGIAVNSLVSNICIRTKHLTVDAFKSFLAAQYEAGTPVTVFYELAEPITTIINQTTLQANIPDTTISLTEANNLGSIRAVLQTKGE